MSYLRHGLPLFTATRHDTVAAVLDPEGFVLVQLGSPLDRHEIMLTANAAAYLRDALTRALAGHQPTPDEEF